MSFEEIFKTLELWLKESGNFDMNKKLKQSDNLKDDLLIDSVALIELIVRMEDETGKIVDDSDLILENFSTAESFCLYFSNQDASVKDF